MNASFFANSSIYIHLFPYSTSSLTMNLSKQEFIKKSINTNHQKIYYMRWNDKNRHIISSVYSTKNICIIFHCVNCKEENISNRKDLSRWIKLLLHYQIIRDVRFASSIFPLERADVKKIRIIYKDWSKVSRAQESQPMRSFWTFVRFLFFYRGRPI